MEQTARDRVKAAVRVINSHPDAKKAMLSLMKEALEDLGRIVLTCPPEKVSDIRNRYDGATSFVNFINTALDNR